MKVKIKTEKEVDVKTLIVRAGVRYWEDSMIDGEEDTDGKLVPCRVGDLWNPIIDIDTGIITNWKQGVTAKIHYKVCDQLGWSLLDVNGDIILSEEDGYVPSTLCPADKGYGDYIIMYINGDGKIMDWHFRVSDFNPED